MTTHAYPAGVGGTEPAPPDLVDPGEGPAAPGRSLVRLVVVLAVIIAVAFAAGVGVTVLLVGALLLCIVAHEAGHFLTAKAAGMKVTEFFVGFGPRLWAVRRGETSYGVKGLPLGGYCKIIGMTNLEEVDPLDEARTYRQQPVWRRLSVALAGSTVHFLLALVILFSMFFFVGDNGNYLTPPPAPSTTAIAAVDPLTTGASPAQAAGLRAGDRIEAVDGQHFATWDQLTSYIRARPGRAIDITVQRGGASLGLRAVPADLSKVQPVGAGGSPAMTPTRPTGFLGVQIDPTQTARPGLVDSLSDTGGAWVHVSALTIHSLGRLLTFQGASSYIHMLGSQQAAASTSPSSVRFASPVKVVQLFNQAGQFGLSSVLWLLAVVNLSLGIFNLIPLLPLDGGHVVIAAYEGVRSRITGRRHMLDVARLTPVFYLAILGIAFIGLTSLFLDLRDLIG